MKRFALLLAGLLACRGDPPTCWAGDYRACACDGGATGYAACRATEDGFGPCPCDGKTPSFDGGVDGGR